MRTMMSSSTNDSETLPINEIDNTAEIIAYRVEKIFQRYFVTLIVFMFLQSFTETLLEKYL